jgi:branched-chain amino acid transport system substrate-binding protein
MDSHSEGKELVGAPLAATSAGSKKGGAVSRREFLKLAALAGGAVGLSGGVGSILAACGSTPTSSATTGTTAQATTTTALATTTTALASTTTAASAEIGRSIKLGYVLPSTGPLAPFSAAGKWAKKHFEDYVADGVVLGDKKKHPFEVVMVDTQSDSNRAAQVTGDLIQNSKVDLILAAVTPETVNPAADVAESFGTPLISNWTEGGAFTLGRKVPAEGFKWTYTFAFDNGFVVQNLTAVLSQLQSYKIVGLVLGNDVDGMTTAQIAPAVLKGAGFKVVQTDLYTPGAEDYTAQLTKLKNAGCELLYSVMLTPDFVNFWTQAHQQSFQPKIAIGHKALIFPEAVAAMGASGYNLCSGGYWTPRAKFKDSLTGMDCQQLAAEYEAFSGTQWSEAVIILGVFEWASDVFKRVASVDDKEGIVTAIKGTKLETCQGLLDYTTPVKEMTHHPAINFVSAPHAACQWVKATSGKWPVDKMIVTTTDPDVMALDGKVQPIQYS